MGRLKDSSLKRKFTNTFIKILLYSFILSVLTFSLWFFLFDYFKKPANYYESQIPSILKELKNIEDLMDDKNKVYLDKLIPEEGIKYEILDMEGNIIYGNTEDIIVNNKKDLIINLNNNISFGNNVFASLFPIMNDKDNLEGVLLLKYSLNPYNKIHNSTFNLFSKLLLFFPFIYIIIFTIYYSKKMSNELNRPIKMLMEASENISNQNLDFTISYYENNELGTLSNAFENMRINLKESLQYQWKLEEKRKENFSAIAHDLKTPLSIIKTYSESLLNKELDDKTKKYLETIYRNNERAITLIKNINNISSIESENFTLKSESVNLLDYINNKKDELINLGREEGVLVEFNITDNRTILYGNYDILRINQVIDNLYSNALRYSDGFIIIEVFLKNNKMECYIENSSSKLSNDDLNNAFEKFYKGDKSRSFKSGHSGLGLYIAKEIVNNHKGDIQISNTDKGVKVEFNITSLL